MGFGVIQLGWRQNRGRGSLFLTSLLEYNCFTMVYFDLDFLPCGQGHSQPEFNMIGLGMSGGSGDRVLQKNLSGSDEEVLEG